MSSPTGDTRMYSIFIYNNVNKLHLSWQNNLISDTTIFYGYSSPEIFPSNIWTHCAIVYSGTKVQIYINGTLYATNNCTKSSRTNFEFNVPFTGSNNRLINDLRIYDHALSPKEVKEISKGLVLHYKLDKSYIKSGTNLITNITAGRQTTKLTDGRLGVITSGVNADTYFTIDLSENITNGTSYILSCNASGISEGAFWGFPLGAQSNTTLLFKIYNGYNQYVFTANDISWGTNRLFMDDINREDYINPATFYDFKLYKLSNTILEVIDSSGYGYNGTINGILTVPNDSPRYNCSSYMPTATKITHPRPVYGGTDQEWTCMMWVKLDGTAQGGQQLNNFNSGNEIVHSANSYPLLYLNSGTNDYYNYGNLAVSANTWTHIAFVFKNSNVTKLIYINGINRTNINGPNKTSTPAGISDTVTIGTNLAGYISDYRIYATALSAEDILELYNTPAFIDNKQNFFAYEFIEDDSAEICKNGVLKGVIFTEDEEVQIANDGQIQSNSLYEI